MENPLLPPSSDAAAAYPLRPAEFKRLATYIESHCGIKMPPNRSVMLQGRLRRRVIATGCSSFAEYCCKLFDEGGLQDEAVFLIDAITTNKTDFFREPEHFRYLVEVALPRLCAEEGAQSRPLKLWSSACSTGAEPYTLAMVLAAAGRLKPGPGAMILASDICTEVLETAARAVYPEALMEPVPAHLRRRFVMPSKDRALKEVRIVPELRAIVRFSRMNLMDAHYAADADMDVIFCRNVLIYFDRTTQLTVLQRLCAHLRSGGFLFVGHSEAFSGFDLPVEQVGPTTFRRVE